MFRCFFPDEYVDSTYVIDFDRLYQEGYRGLILTLIIHLYRTGHRQMHARSRCLSILRSWDLAAAFYPTTREREFLPLMMRLV